MRKFIISFCIALFSLTTFSNPITGGDTTNVEGKLVLYLMAGHYYNGVYYGQFLGDRIMDVMENYVITHTFGGAYGYQQIRQVFDQDFVVDQKYIDIAEGIIAGMQTGGFSIYSPTLGEELTYKDILIANTIPDFQSYKGMVQTHGPGCSDLSSWGEATENDSWLDGETVISRNLDWESHPVLINNQLIIVWGQSDLYTQNFITIGFAGMIGALSGFNESGVATFQNMGNHYLSPVGSGFYPINLAQRNGLEASDYNGDGICSPRDITDAVRDKAVASTYIVHSAGRANLDFPAEILEIHNSLGDTIRIPSSSTPAFTDNLIATNHFRLLTSPSYCPRYNRICDSLELSQQMSVARNWDVLTTAGVTSNLQTIQYTPKNEIFWLSFAEPGIPAYQIEPTKIYANDLFLLLGIHNSFEKQEFRASIIPNPCKSATNITFNVDNKGFLDCKIIDIQGHVVHDFGRITLDSQSFTLQWNTTNISKGVYYCIAEYTNTTKDTSKKSSQKIIVSR
ncbi:MAG: T9SS type A sorting domain-containing protein [Bacteroidales bacterium]|nr:T9SS type A sorting domain-containing protein [Bacteroidales bacterium]MCF8388060.1 T9SS type A sorting domain-containing protein [Bacteroidales bacterium]MCF8398883.1 T9SS type A sorting domain-containing protein [Bacteroidales bacterium]